MEKARQGCKLGLVKKSETLQLMPKLKDVQICAWSGSLSLESEECGAGSQ